MQSLQPFHSFHLAAAARQIIEIHDTTQLTQAWADAARQQLPVLFLGQGSNMLFLQDFQGVVLINRLRGITHRQDRDFHYLHVGGGENWHELVQWTLEQGIGGLENLALIPGCAGSAPVQNIGAYGVEFKDVCDYVDVLHPPSGETFRLTAAECQFSYRDSVFKHRYAWDYIVTSVGLKLAKNYTPMLKYGALADLDPSAVSAHDIFDEVCNIRSIKLPDPAQFGNAGSFFKNPIVSADQFAALQKQAENRPHFPHFPQPDGSVKLAAGWLIDQCGLKGVQIGGAAVHDKQALVLINKNGATGVDVLALARFVHRTVRQRFGVSLEPEVRFIAADGEIDSLAAVSQMLPPSLDFNGQLAALPTIDGVRAVAVYDGERQIHQIDAVPGKRGSLQVYAALNLEFDGKFDRTSAQQGLTYFAEHVEDAKANPGKHPNIDLLFKVLAENLTYRLITLK